MGAISIQRLGLAAPVDHPRARTPRASDGSSNRLIVAMFDRTMSAVVTLTPRMRPLGWLAAFALLASCSGGGGKSATSTYPTAGSYLPGSPPVEPLSHFARLGVPVDAVTDHRLTRIVSLDGGALRIGPPGVESAAVSLATSTRLVAVAMVNQQASYNPALVTLARVTISVPGAGGVPGYRNRLAWLGFLTRRPGGTSCGGLGGASSARYIYVEPFGAVVLDARTGKSAITYWS